MSTDFIMNHHGTWRGKVGSALRTLYLPRQAMKWFIVLTALKIVGFAVLAHTGLLRPFTGDNAISYYLPIAERLLTEHRLNGPDSRHDSWVSIGSPALLALTKIAAPQSFLTVTVIWQIILDGLVATLLYLVGMRTCGRVPGFLAGVFWLIY